MPSLQYLFLVWNTFEQAVYFRSSKLVYFDAVIKIGLVDYQKAKDMT